MKRLKPIISLSIIVSLFSANAVLAQSNQDKEIESIANQLVEKISSTEVKNVAVADFANLDGTYSELGKYLATEFSFALTSIDKNFNIIDRSKINFLLKEAGEAEGGLVDPNTIAKLGNVKGIDAIVSGSLTPQGNNMRVFINVLQLETASVIAAVRGDISLNPTIIEMSERGVVGNSVKRKSSSPKVISKSNTKAPPASPIEIDKGLIAYYPFNGNAKDESKNNNNGVVYGATLTQDRFGNENSAYDFDGKNDFIEVLVDSEEFRTIDEFTLSVWVNFRSFEKKVVWESFLDRQFIFNGTAHSKSVTDDFHRDGFNLFFDWGKNEEALVGHFNGGNKIFKTSVPEKNEWTQIILRVKGGLFFIYNNGQLRCKEQTNSSKMDMYHSLFIGTFSGNNRHHTKGNINHSFNGKIDDIAIYNRALSDEEILQLSEDK